VTVAALGLGLIFGCLNVFFRDSENLVDLILMIATWVSPVLYPADRGRPEPVVEQLDGHGHRVRLV